MSISIKERIARGFARLISRLFDGKPDPGVVITPLSDDEIKRFKEMEASTEWVAVRPYRWNHPVTPEEFFKSLEQDDASKSKKA